MPKFEKGSEEAIRQGQKMREARERKKEQKDELQGILKNLMILVGGVEKRLAKLEQRDIPEYISTPSIQGVSSTETAGEPIGTEPIEGLEILPYKAKELLKAEFPEAKIFKVQPHPGGFLIILDVTHLTGGQWITSMVKGMPKRQHAKDYRNIPVRTMYIEKDIKDWVKKIKQNMGWIKTEQTPQFIKRELKPEERPLPPGVEGTPEAEFFTRNVE